MIKDTEISEVKYPQGSFGVSLALQEKDIDELIINKASFINTFISPALQALANKLAERRICK
jgi:hypothetical protein